MMRHADDKLTAFLHAELDPVAAHEVKEHVAACAECAAVLARLQRGDALIAGLLPVKVPADLWTAIESRLPAPGRRRFRRRWWIAAAAAALILLVLAIVTRIGSPPIPMGGSSLEMATFLDALESAPREADSREFAILPVGFRKLDAAEAARASGMGDRSPAPGSKLYGGRVLERDDDRIYELIYGDDEGAYLLFIGPEAARPDFGERALRHLLEVSATCVQVASERLSVLWDAGGDRQWILVGRDHPESFYAAVMRSVAETLRPSQAAFNWIQDLAGEWEGTFEWTGARTATGGLEIEYSPTGLGSAMVETHRSRDLASMSSVYHMDGSRLVATHFCVQNQPRLEATEIDSDQRSIRFELRDVTDLGTGEGHVDGLEMLLADPDAITLRYHYVQDGKRAVENIHLTRRGERNGDR